MIVLRCSTCEHEFDLGLSTEALSEEVRFHALGTGHVDLEVEIKPELPKLRDIRGES